jgi:dihydroorotate dehydrogenase (NAD+) catalytic subunit
VSVAFCGLSLAHRVVNGSGTFDAIAARAVFGEQIERAFPFAAYVSKTITLQPRAGNPPPRLWEAPGGMINSIGLPNKGLAGYLTEDLPRLSGFVAAVPRAGGEAASSAHQDGALPVPLITNVMGSTDEEFCALVDACDAREEIDAIELNVSCPNVSTGLDIGADPAALGQMISRVRPRTQKPLIVKLTPNTADVAGCAAAAEVAGADAVSLINTLRAMAFAPARANAHAGAWLGGGTGGLSGPAVRTVALAQVCAVAERVAVPVVGMGGIETASHARDMLDAGATLVAVGTASFRDPQAAAGVARGLAGARA